MRPISVLSALAATVVSTPVFETFLSDDADKALMHGPTYSGHALACAAANASLDLFEAEPRLTQVAAIAAQLAEFRSADRNVLTAEEWHAMSGQMGGVAAMGGAVLGPAPADTAAPAPPPMEHQHH